jgi:hypothetical protein
MVRSRLFAKKRSVPRCPAVSRYCGRVTLSDRVTTQTASLIGLPVRLGGEMLAPDVAADPIQFVDVRDLARFTLNLLERNVVGTFNVVSPPGRFTMGDLVEASASCANALAKPSAPPRPICGWPDDQCD